MRWGSEDAGRGGGSVGRRRVGPRFKFHIGPAAAVTFTCAKVDVGREMWGVWDGQGIGIGRWSVEGG